MNDKCNLNDEKVIRLRQQTKTNFTRILTKHQAEEILRPFRESLQSINTDFSSIPHATEEDVRRMVERLHR